MILKSQFFKHTLVVSMCNILKLYFVWKSLFAWSNCLLNQKGFYFLCAHFIELVIRFLFQNIRISHFLIVLPIPNKVQCIGSNCNIKYTWTCGWIPIKNNFDRTGTTGSTDSSADSALDLFCVKLPVIHVFIILIVLFNFVIWKETNTCHISLEKTHRTKISGLMASRYSIQIFSFWNVCNI